MNYLDGITLEEWLEERKSLEKRLIKQIEINAALGFCTLVIIWSITIVVRLHMEILMLAM